MRWLKNESYHQKGLYCTDEACRVCASWRVIHKGNQDMRQALASLMLKASEDAVDVVACGFEYGEKIALDALTALATVQPPEPMIGNLRFGQALRQGFRTTLQRHLVQSFA